MRETITPPVLPKMLCASREKRTPNLAHFFICVFVGEAAASSDNDLGKAGDRADCHQNQNSRNQGTLSLNQLKCLLRD